MARYLMTHSLLSSWLYTMKGNPYEDMTSAKDGFAEFITTLNRQPIETTDAMRKGNEFEDLVTEIVDGDGDTSHNWYAAAEKAAGIIRGGLLQYRARREIQVGDLSLVLYGRLDALKAGVIYDTKFSSGYETGKYIGSTQHPTYFELVPEAKEFTYLVSNGSYLWPETYRREETKSILPIISDFLDWLEVQDLMDVYKDKWLAL